MKTKSQLWNELVTANAGLGTYTPMADNTEPRSIHLEQELAVNATFLAKHVNHTLGQLADASKLVWLNRLLNGEQGIIHEAYAYGELIERQFHFTADVQVNSTELYRSSTGMTSLDGKFNFCETLFDIKSLSRPSGILGSLLDRVNQRINANNRVVMVDGSLDFDHRFLDGLDVSAAVDAISTASGNPFFKHPQIPCAFRFFDVDTPIKYSLQTFNPYRFAEENRHIVLTHAKQVHRTSRFTFLYVYTELDHELAAFPDFSPIGERALARRVFMELDRNAHFADQYCSQVAAGVRVEQVVKSIGGLMFLGVRQRESKASLRCYLNPNANAQQKIATDHLEQMANFTPHAFDVVEGFEFDNY